jgi:hypothetical protein
MIVGILSDTHGNDRSLAAALEVFRARGVGILVHCGDVGSARCMHMLGAYGGAVYVVAGNMDRHLEDLSHTAAECGVNFAEEVIEVPLGGGMLLAATHGNDPVNLSGLISSGRYRYICHGHTHRPTDQTVGKVRLINPGALDRAKTRTIAILDTQQDALEQVVLKI